MPCTFDCNYKWCNKTSFNANYKFTKFVTWSMIFIHPLTIWLKQNKYTNGYLILLRYRCILRPAALKAYRVPSQWNEMLLKCHSGTYRKWKRQQISDTTKMHSNEFSSPRQIISGNNIYKIIIWSISKLTK